MGRCTVYCNLPVSLLVKLQTTTRIQHQERYFRDNMHCVFNFYQIFSLGQLCHLAFSLCKLRGSAIFSTSQTNSVPKIQNRSTCIFGINCRGSHGWTKYTVLRHLSLCGLWIVTYPYIFKQKSANKIHEIDRCYRSSIILEYRMQFFNGTYKWRSSWRRRCVVYLIVQIFLWFSF